MVASGDSRFFLSWVFHLQNDNVVFPHIQTQMTVFIAQRHHCTNGINYKKETAVPNGNETRTRSPPCFALWNCALPSLPSRYARADGERGKVESRNVAFCFSGLPGADGAPGPLFIAGPEPPWVRWAQDPALFTCQELSCESLCNAAHGPASIPACTYRTWEGAALPRAAGFCRPPWSWRGRAGGGPRAETPGWSKVTVWRG